ncbi:MAG: IS66 family insertion sequence element accessory protein TnpA, partial [Parahaliea sp.]
MSSTDHPNNWQQHITTWQASALSGAAFCREHGLVYHRFTYWRQKLTAPSPAQVGAPAGFAKVVPVPQQPSRGELTLSLPNGITLTGLRADNVSLLGAILAQL